MEEQKDSRKTTIIAIVAATILIVIAVIAYAAISAMGANTGDGPKLVEVKDISARVLSEENGGMYRLQASFTVALSEDAAKRISKQSLHNAISIIAGKMEYDKINAHDGEGYMKDAIKNGLGEYIDSSDIKAIYVTDFRCGNEMLPKETEKTDDRVNELGGAFKDVY